MEKSKNSKENSGKSVKSPSYYNDQLGENASEEYASEIYDNAAEEEEDNPKK